MICIWILGFPKLVALGVLIKLLKFILLILAELLCYCLCLFDAIMEIPPIGA